VPAAWSPFQRAQFVEIARRCAVERCASYTLVAVGMQSYVGSENAWPALSTAGTDALAPEPSTADDAVRSGHR